MRYAFADSSPQAGHDWLISQVRCIDKHHITSVFEATVSLIEDSLASAQEERDFENNDDPCLGHRRADRPALFRVLKEHIKSFTFPPVALGISRTSLEDKAAALLYAMFLDVSYHNLKVIVGLCNIRLRTIRFLAEPGLNTPDKFALYSLPPPSAEGGGKT